MPRKQEHKNPKQLPLMDASTTEDRTLALHETVRKRKTALTNSGAPASGGHMSQVSHSALGGAGYGK